MAGYFLYSLDWSKLQPFLQDLDEATLRQFCEKVSSKLDYYDSSFEADDPCADWPCEIESLLPIVKERLGREDWYGDLSDDGKQMWQEAFEDFCTEHMGFECESDGVYWNVHSEALKHHGIKEDTITDVELTHFGNRPLRYHGTRRTFDDWCPYHSMHTPEEVAKIRSQFEAAEEAIRASRHEDASMDYDELMPVLDKLVKTKRVLYVGVDT